MTQPSDSKPNQPTRTAHYDGDYDCSATCNGPHIEYEHHDPTIIRDLSEGEN